MKTTTINEKLFPDPRTWLQAEPPRLEPLQMPAGVQFIELLSGASEIGNAIREAGLESELVRLLATLEKRSRLARMYSAAAALVSGNTAFGVLAIQWENEPAPRIDLSIFEFEEQLREIVSDLVSDFLLVRADHLICAAEEVAEDNEELAS